MKKTNEHRRLRGIAGSKADLEGQISRVLPGEIECEDATPEVARIEDIVCKTECKTVTGVAAKS